MRAIIKQVFLKKKQSFLCVSTFFPSKSKKKEGENPPLFYHAIKTLD